jgi:polysaccharide biosynthesis protein PelE
VALPRALLLSAAAGALALELTFAWGLWESGGQEGALVLVIAHAIGSALLARVLVALLDDRIPSLAVAAAFLVCVLSPLLNVFVFLPAAIILRLAPETAEDTPLAGFALLRPAVPAAGYATVSAHAAATLYDEAGLVSVLKRSRDPERRCGAVLSAMRLADRERIRLLQLALRDPEDEVRLLAYGLLEQKTQSVTNRMQEHQARLDAAATPGEAAALHRALASDAWQLVDLGLVQGEVSRHYLASSKRHLTAAIRLAPKSPGLHFLLGRILLALGDPQSAHAAFRTAQSCGLVPTGADLLILERTAASLAVQADGRSEHFPAEPEAVARVALQHAS